MISFCIIARNEETNIEECLKRIIPLEYEIVVVDTGSTDKTKEIALRYTDKVFDFQWVNDFAAARNFSIQKASNDYVFIVDCDEMLVNFQKKDLERLININSKGVGRILRINKFTRGGQTYRGHERVSRLFHRKEFQYEGIIHEQIVSKGGTQSFYNIPFEFEHLGYEGDFETRKKKTQRNIALLKKQLEEKKEPYTLYQLGKSYYMEREYKRANMYFSQALEYDLEPSLEYVQDMVEVYGYSLLDAKEYSKAKGLLNIYEEFSHSADFLFLIALVYMNNGSFAEAICEFDNAASKKECKMEGVNSYLAWYNVGVIYECIGDYKKAKKYYIKCGNYDMAKERLKSI